MHIWQHRFQIEKGMNDILAEIRHEIHSSKCLVQQTELEPLKWKPLSWWQDQACIGQFESIQFYYVISLKSAEVIIRMVLNDQQFTILADLERAV